MSFSPAIKTRRPLTALDLGANNISDISALSFLTSLIDCELYVNNISDINALSGLTSLSTLDLYKNSTSDISPLVDNSGINNGDYVYLQYHPLSDDSINIYIPELESRGVAVLYCG